MAKKLSRAERYEMICLNCGISFRECKVLSFERGEHSKSIGTFHFHLMWKHIPIIIFDGVERGVNVIIVKNEAVMAEIRTIAKGCGFIEVTTNLA